MTSKMAAGQHCSLPVACSTPHIHTHCCMMRGKLATTFWSQALGLESSGCRPVHCGHAAPAPKTAPRPQQVGARLASKPKPTLLCGSRHQTRQTRQQTAHHHAPPPHGPQNERPHTTGVEPTQNLTPSKAEYVQRGGYVGIKSQIAQKTMAVYCPWCLTYASVHTARTRTPVRCG